MSDAVFVALISGAVTLAGVLLSNGTTVEKLELKLEELTKEMRELGGFAQRVPILEMKLAHNEARLAKLEQDL